MTGVSSLPTLFLHAGVPNSGADAALRLIAGDRAAFLARGLRYPGRHLNHGPEIRDLIDDGSRGPATRSNRTWRQLAAEIERRQESVLLSGEGLSSIREKQIDQVLRSLTGYSIHVVISTRDLPRMLASAWQQRIAEGGTRTLESFVDRLRRSREEGAPNAFWTAHDLPDVLASWSGHLPEDRIHVVTAPPARATGVGIESRYLEAVGIEPEAALDVPQEAEWLALAECEFLRRVNEGLAAQELNLGSARARRLMVRRLRARTRTRRHSAPTLQRSDRDWAAAVAHSWRLAVAGHSYQLHGSWDDLVPDVDAPETPPVLEADVVSAGVQSITTLLRRLPASHGRAAARSPGSKGADR